MEGFSGIRKGRKSFGDEESNAVTDAAFSFVRHFFRPRPLDGLYSPSPLTSPDSFPSCSSGLVPVLPFLCLESTQWPSGEKSAGNCAVPFPRPLSAISLWLNRGDASVTRRRSGGSEESRSTVGGTLAHSRVCDNHRRGGRMYSGPSPRRRRPPTDTSRRRSPAKSETRNDKSLQFGVY